MTRIAINRDESDLYVEHEGKTTYFECSGRVIISSAATVDDALSCGFTLLFDNTTPKPVTLKHREGEYVHFTNKTGTFNWTITCDGDEWYQDDLDCHPYGRVSAQYYADGAGDYHVVSHGFLTGEVKPARKVKWPKGALVQSKTNSRKLFTVAADVLEDAVWFLAVGYSNSLEVVCFQRVEIKVVD